MTEAVTSDPAQGPALALLALVLGALKTTHGFRQAGGRLCCFFLGGKNVCVCGGGGSCVVSFSVHSFMYLLVVGNARA